MRNILFSIEVILLFGGTIVCAVGLLWGKGAQFLGLFGVEANPDRGFKVAISGLAMLLAGAGFLYLNR